jgi:4-amino-4-deoxy-L-arabinose transferase-like glycosyltransferase
MSLAEARAGAGPARAVLLFVLAVTAVRLAFAAAIPLTEDEAYYRLWATSLQFGYYDHPPMIAWWIRAGMSLVGDNPLGVRLLPALSSGLTSLLIYDLAQRLGGSAQVGARAAVWFNATLLIAAGGFLATPDAAAVPFWTLTVWCLARAVESPRWWIAAGAAAGLACIGKYSALFLGPGVLIWLLFLPGGLKRLQSPWPWAAAFVAGLIFSTNIGWNATHHWASFDKQFGRAAPGRIAPQFLAELIAGQVLLLNPATAWFAVRGAGEAWRGRKLSPDAAGLTLILATTAPFAAYLVLHSLHDRVQAHWPAPLYPGLAILAAFAAEAAPLGGFQGGLKRIAAPLGLGLAALIMLHLALPATDVRGARDPSEEVRGWSDFAARVEALRIQDHAAWIGTLSYGVDGQLAAQNTLHAPVAELNERDRYPPGEGSWAANLDKPGLVLDLDRRIDASLLQRCFASVAPAGELIRGKPGYRPIGYAAFVVSGPKREVLRQGCW